LNADCELLIDSEKQMVMATNKLRMVNFEMLIFDCGFKKKEMRQIKSADLADKTRSFENP